MQHIEEDRHLLGSFQLGEKKSSGEIIYNRKSGMLLLSIQRPTSGLGPAKAEGFIPQITGQLNAGPHITLYHNKCIQNHTQLFSNQHLIYRSDYFILGQPQEQYNRLICVLENALNWSELSAMDLSDYCSIRPKSFDPPEYHWFGADIRFKTEWNNDLFAFPRKEECRIVERLLLEIDSDEKRPVSYFTQIRDKVIALISFAIKDNVNIEEQFLVDFDDYESFGEHKEYNRRSFVSTEPRPEFLMTELRDYNFFRTNLSDDKDIQESLVKLEPVFNLYLSLFKYPGMPVEMVFLNMVQALETYHSRFYYNDRKDVYIESANHRFANSPHFEHLKGLLLSDTQMDENCKHIILVSRLNDLLVGEFNGLFSDYYMADNTFAQRIADTRHYYTHYPKSKEAKAFRGDDLYDAIYLLRLLLEYYICRSLKVDIDQKTREALAAHGRRKAK